MADQALDLRGARCPLPIVRLNTSIKAVEPGEQLAFVADDPASLGPGFHEHRPLP